MINRSDIGNDKKKDNDSYIVVLSCINTSQRFPRRMDDLKNNLGEDTKQDVYTVLWRTQFYFSKPRRSSFIFFFLASFTVFPAPYNASPTLIHSIFHISHVPTSFFVPSAPRLTRVALYLCNTPSLESSAASPRHLTPCPYMLIHNTVAYHPCTYNHTLWRFHTPEAA